MADAHDKRHGVDAEPGRLTDSTVSEPRFAAGVRPRQAREDNARASGSADDKTRAGPAQIGSDWPFV